MACPPDQSKGQSMNRRELDLLEKIYGYEIEAALSRRVSEICGSRSKTASKLESDGYIKEVTRAIGEPVFFLTGYVLTHAGRLAYIMSDRCDGGVK